MKTKKINKTLTLNKTTIARLDGEAMENVFGGGSGSCGTICRTCLSGPAMSDCPPCYPHTFEC